MTTKLPYCATPAWMCISHDYSLDLVFVRYSTSDTESDEPMSLELVYPDGRVRWFDWCGSSFVDIPTDAVLAADAAPRGTQRKVHASLSSTAAMNDEHNTMFRWALRRLKIFGEAHSLNTWEGLRFDLPLNKKEVR